MSTDMALCLRELRPEDREAIAAVVGDAPDWERALAAPNRCRSLIALDDADAAGAILFDGQCYRLFVDPERRDGETARRLIDVAMHKLRQAGLHRCRIDLGDGAASAFWEAVRWDTSTDAAA